MIRMSSCKAGIVTIYYFYLSYLFYLFIKLTNDNYKIIVLNNIILLLLSSSFMSPYMSFSSSGLAINFIVINILNICDDDDDDDDDCYR
jgi:predicted MPP superfamily phosphohydrolase